MLHLDVKDDGVVGEARILYGVDSDILMSNCLSNLSQTHIIKEHQSQTIGITM
jgi:hypothetical protein